MKIKSETFEKMAIPFTVSIAAEDTFLACRHLQKVVPQLKKELSRIENDYSPFIETSLVSRYQKGEKTVLFDNDEFQEIFAATIMAKDLTVGAFNPYFSDQYDPTGYTKGWAIEKVFGQVLHPLLGDKEISGVCLNGGGDLQFESQNHFFWNIGIENPLSLQEIISSYHLENGAVATSGRSKRGRHIKIMGKADLEQVTIYSNSLAYSDIWATAGMAAGGTLFNRLISKFKLTGIYMKQNGDLVIFERGRFQHVSAT